MESVAVQLKPYNRALQLRLCKHTLTPLTYLQISSPSPYVDLSRRNSRIASLLYSLPSGSATTGLVSGLRLSPHKKKRSRCSSRSVFSALPRVLTRSRRSGIEPPSAPMVAICMR